MARSDYLHEQARVGIRARVSPSSRAERLVRATASASGWHYSLRRSRLLRSFSIDVGRGAVIGERLSLPHPFAIVIGAGTVIGDDVTMYHGTTLGQVAGRYPTIGDRSILLPGSMVLGEVHLPAGSIVLPGEIRVER